MADYFSKAVDRISTPTYLSNKRDIVEYYRDTYGERGWKRQAAIAMSGTTDSKSRAYQSAMRNFQGKRLSESGSTGKWKSLGRELPPVSRTVDGKAEITIKAKQQGNKGRPERNRTITVKMSQSQAQDFVNDPTWDKVWDAYGFDFGIEDEPGEIDADYTLTDVSVS